MDVSEAKDECGFGGSFIHEFGGKFLFLVPCDEFIVGESAELLLEFH